MTRPILITGAAGFIGSHLVERLLGEGRRVVGVDNFCDFYPQPVKRRNVARAVGQPGFELAEIDIRDAAAVGRLFAEHRPAGVIHLAAMAGVRPSIERPAYYTQVNVDGTVNLLDAAVRNGAERFVFASSSSVYGNKPRSVPFGEDDPVDAPISPYAATKRAGELICHTYAHLHGLPIACLRFFTVFGPRQRPDLAIGKFLRLVAAGEPIPMFGDGSTSRDYTYIDDIIAGVAAAYERCDLGSAPGGAPGIAPGSTPGYRIYNLGNDSPVTLRELIATIEAVTGERAKIERQPMQPGDVDRTWADVSRARRELGYEPRTPLAEGIERQWRWMCEEREMVHGGAES